MGWGFERIFCLLTLQALLVIQFAPSADAYVGVVYGYEANNLPLNSQVVTLLNKNAVTEVRIYDTSPDVLKAFMGSNIQVIVGINNSDLVLVGATNASAMSWVTTNILPYITSVNITGVSVGNEVMTTFAGYSPFLAQAMIWIRTALATNGLGTRIVVSTPLSTNLLQSNFPPSQAVFNHTLVPAIIQVLSFLNSTQAPLMLNVHAFDAFQVNSAAISMEYALFEASTPLTDAYTGLQYYSLFSALVDSTYAAMAAVGFGNMRVLISESGWPSLGDSNENGANASNAQTYNSNLVALLMNGTGTPANRIPLSGYVFELFNENLLGGPTSMRNYGLFSYNLTAVYSVDLNGDNQTLTSNGTQYQTWCVAMPNADNAKLLSALNYACGQGGVNCAPISAGGSCDTPDTLLSHSSWAFNAYYQKNANAPGTCDFNGVAYIVSFNPSYSSCVFQASNVTTTVGGSPIPPTSPSSDSAPAVKSAYGLCGLAVFFVLNFRYLLK